MNGQLGMSAEDECEAIAVLRFVHTHDGKQRSGDGRVEMDQSSG